VDRVDVAVGHNRDSNLTFVASANPGVETEPEWILPAPFARISVVKVVVGQATRNPELDDAGRFLRSCRESCEEYGRDENERPPEHGHIPS
jgi:hypothetical protein